MKYLKPIFLAIALFCLGLTGLKAQTVTDVDGNIYKTVTIGTQVWMAENLKTTHFADGTPIPKVTGDTNWYELPYRSKAYCWYDNDSATNASTYGVLYNWAAAMNIRSAAMFSGSEQGVCPTGWILPTGWDWVTFWDYLGGANVAGGKLKETDTIHWNSPNIGATNETGFTALPGGYRTYFGDFFDIGYYGFWWSADQDALNHNAKHWNMCNETSALRWAEGSMKLGFSVRCLKVDNTSIPYPKNSEKVILYPNPATEKLFLKNGNYTNGTIMIFDLQGKQVLSKQMDSNPIDISGLEKGIYVLKFVGLENVWITKFIKE